MSLAGAARTVWYSCACAGNVSRSCQRAPRASAREAAIAWYSRCAITATKLPSRTTFSTPGSFSAAPLSSDASAAWCRSSR